MPKRHRRRFTADQKVSILREHLLERNPISEVCEAHGIQPSMFYRWQKKFFENGVTAFTGEKDTEKQQLQQRVDQLQSRLQHKDAIIAAVTEEFVRVKKELGEP